MNFIFDVDDTLYDVSQPFQRAYQKLWEGKYEVDLNELFRLSRMYANRVFDKMIRKEITVDESGVYRIKMAMRDFGYEIHDDEAFKFQQAYRHFQGNIIMSDTMKNILNYLRSQNITIGVLTNGISAHQRAKINGLQLHQWFKDEDIFVSDEIGYSKPDARAFEHIEKMMHIKKGDTWYIGDAIDHDVYGAYHAGWHMIYLNRRGNDLTKEDPSVDYIVRSEEELFALLQKLTKESHEVTA